MATGAGKTIVWRCLLPGWEATEAFELDRNPHDTQQDKTKREFLDEWVRGVNGYGSFGMWQWAVSKDPADVAGVLENAMSK